MKSQQRPRVTTNRLCDLGLFELILHKDGTATAKIHGYHNSEDTYLTADKVEKLRKFLGVQG